MKSIVAVGAIVFALAAAGCGSSTHASTPPTPSPSGGRGPSITSSTFPDPKAGYLKGTFSASWTTPGESGVSGFAVAIDDSPDTQPDAVTQTGSSISQTGVQPGTHFLHVRAKTADGWSPTSVFAFTVLQLVKPAPSSVNAGTTLVQSPMPEGSRDLRYQFRLADALPWTTIQADRLTLADGSPTSGSAERNPATGLTPLWRWNMLGTLLHDRYPGKGGQLEFAGLAALRAVMTDSQGRTIATPASLVRLDRTPPPYPRFTSVTGRGPDDTVASGRSVVLRWKPGGPDVAGYSFALSRNPRAEAPKHIDLGPHATRYVVKPQAAGDWFVLLRVVDHVGNWSPTAFMRLHYQAALVLSPTDGQNQASSTLPITMSGGAGTSVCWWWHTPADNQWKRMPPQHITYNGAPLRGWPARLSAGVTRFVWSNFAATPGIDNWPGEIDFKATSVPASQHTCAGGTGLTEVSIFYEPR